MGVWNCVFVCLAAVQSAHGPDARVQVLSDLDGDGWSEIAFAAPDDDWERGRVVVFSVRTSEVVWSACGTFPGARFGERVWNSGDVDGDAVDDVGVSARLGEEQRFGRSIRVISGRRARIVETVDVPGSSWRGAGTRDIWFADRDGDGCTELCVYDPFAERVLSPNIRGELTMSAESTLAERAHGLVAHAIIELGRDVDGDGRDDLVHAETRGTASGTSRRLRVVSRATGATLRELEVQCLGDYGHALGFVPDRDGDTLPEIAVSAPLLGGGEEPWMDCLDDARCVIHSSRDFSVLETRREVRPLVPFHGATPLAYDRDIDGDGVIDWIVGMRIVRGSDVRARRPSTERSELRTFRWPPAQREPFVGSLPGPVPGWKLRDDTAQVDR